AVRLLSTGRQIGLTIKSASRLRTIVGVFVKHGFENIAERARLGRFVLRRVMKSESANKYSTAERLRMSFEEVGPTFLKLGQLLATRPDLIPTDMVEEFKKLHDRVKPLEFSEVQNVLREEYEDFDSLFTKIDSTPLGSASIAQ